MPYKYIIIIKLQAKKFLIHDYAHDVFVVIEMNQKISWTKSAASPINISPVAACFKIVNPFLCFPSSPAAVTIWKPPHRRITSAIVPKSPRIKFIASLIAVINFGFPSSTFAVAHNFPAHGIFKPIQVWLSTKLVSVALAKAGDIAANHIIPIRIAITAGKKNFFMSGL